MNDCSFLPAESPDTIRRDPWLTREAHGDERLLGLIVQREIIINDIVGSGEHTDDGELHDMLHETYTAISDRKQEVDGVSAHKH